ncbi:MAG: 16S rRNA (cytosine(1402)-N(4))-methyltransferase RsmH [Burkholderiaceae bacterium]|nr:16S rRNA (cytosine(1402)-N(4))-methyltransferase RsmH [Burkholderiaceae bacterium]MCD8515847.1 16S rRNA (cytosine(1402)-N(4))-methyltransferase RsmH [Burkholderiaceae bacterium]
MTEFSHRTVLLEETVQALVPDEQVPATGVYVDGTYGRGGHSDALLKRLGAQARLLVIDKDPQAIAVAKARTTNDPRIVCIHGGFGDLRALLDAHGVQAVNGVMMDLGVSSPQLDQAERGFSFMRDGPLDMRMDTSQGQTAAQWLAVASLDEVREVIRDYGEERFALQIAKAIVARREVRPIERTLDLADIVAAAVRTREKGQHPATRTFQAIRIYLNRELEELDRALEAALGLLVTGGRLAVISFHSLEDRRVKQFMQAASRVPAELARLPLREDQLPKPLLAGVKRVRPSAAEVADNPRARSAVLRVAERTDTPLTRGTA